MKKSLPTLILAAIALLCASLLYAAEGRPGGDAAASALLSVAANMPTRLPQPYN